MGRDKLGLPWGRSTILQRSIAPFVGLVDEIVVVMAPGRQGPVGTRTITNPRPERGLSSSIKCGVLGTSAKTLIFFLGDLPSLSRRTVKRILQSHRRWGKISVPVYRGQQGHPVVFDRRYVADLLRLKGDHGARCLLKRHDVDVLRISTRSPGVLRDVDTSKDYVSPG